MSEQSNSLKSDVLDVDDVVENVGEDVQDLYDSAESAEFDELVEGLDDLDGVSPDMAEDDEAGKSNKNERLWLIVTLLAFALALLSALVLSPMVTKQAQRVDKAEELVSKISLTTNSAEQALASASGQYDDVTNSILETEAALQQLVEVKGLSGSLSDKLFGNADHNAKINQQWTNYKALTEQFLANREGVTTIKQRLATLSGRLTKVVSDSVAFVEAVAKEGRNKSTNTSKDKYLFLTSEASNLNGILGRLATTLRGYFLPGTDLARLSDSQNGLMVRLQETLNRIVSNSAAVVGTAAEPLREQYSDLESRVLAVGDQAGAMSESRAVLQQLNAQSGVLIESIQSGGNESGLSSLLGRLSTILPLLFGLLGVFSLWRYTQVQTQDLVMHDAGLEETLADQQESILKLLDEMSALADGDLTVEAEVTDQITGAIADSVNFAVIEMRELVSQINRASIEVANESELAVSNAQAVSQSNMSQAEKISQASELMQRVSNSMREMTEQANSSASMATESIHASERGAQAVRDTISGMEDMREQIQDTSKRIKRLGESSQRIGDIVALIDDIAEQTNILSLNAAIQASMAGEAGRGFAVVSDEVQSLAERSTEATKKIAELVTTIQNDTNDAVLSMEKATQQVVSGTKVADSAGTALAEIENVSQRLSGLVEGISRGSNEQAETVTKVSEEVTEISDSSTDTSRKAQDSANSIAKLLELAKDLETSVSRFKLPAS